MALVQAPVVLDRDPHQLHLVEDQPERADRAHEHRRECDVEREARVRERTARCLRLVAALGREVDVGPAGEQVLLVPIALSVTDEHELAGCRAAFLFSSCAPLFRSSAPEINRGFRLTSREMG